MSRIVKAAEARLDLYEIWEHIAIDSEKRAAGLIDRFDGVFAMLAENPYAGRNRNEVRPGLRSFALSPYVVFYRPLVDSSTQAHSADGIEVVRVVHGARDIDRIF